MTKKSHLLTNSHPFMESSWGIIFKRCSRLSPDLLWKNSDINYWCLPWIQEGEITSQRPQICYTWCRELWKLNNSHFINTEAIMVSTWTSLKSFLFKITCIYMYTYICVYTHTYSTNIYTYTYICTHPHICRHMYVYLYNLSTIYLLRWGGRFQSNLPAWTR